MVVDKGVSGLNVRELLSRVCPGREFTPSELEAASMAVSSFMTMDVTSRMPKRFVPVGGRYEKGESSYVCVERPVVRSVSDACLGCVFSKSSSPDRWCLGLQCSKWDRADGRNVWFVEEADSVE